MDTTGSATLEAFKNLLKNFNLDEEKTGKILSKMKKEHIKKGLFFSKEGKRSNKLGILLRGCLVAYYKNEKGEEVASRFYEMPNLLQNIVVCSFDSFNNGTNANESIEVIEDSDLFVISKNDLDELYNEVPELNKMGRILAENSYINAMNRIHILQTLKVKERVKKFENEFKFIKGRVKVQHIATYLGMDRKSYSKMIKNN